MTFSQVHNSADLMKKLPNPTLNHQKTLYKIHLANKKCICYNALRQKDKSIYNAVQRTNPRMYGGTLEGSSSFAVRSSVWAGYRLSIAVQPLVDAVANYPSHDSDRKRQKHFHLQHPPSCPGIGAVTYLLYPARQIATIHKPSTTFDNHDPSTAYICPRFRYFAGVMPYFS